jgi:hypothetical protein
MTKTLEALQELHAVKQAKPGRCSTTCILNSLIIWVP